MELLNILEIIVEILLKKSFIIIILREIKLTQKEIIILKSMKRMNMKEPKDIFQDLFT